MPPEIDDRSAGPSRDSIFDLLAFHQGLSGGELKSTAAARNSGDTLSFSDPYKNSLAFSQSGHLYPNPFSFHQGEKKDASIPSEQKPGPIKPVDFKQAEKPESDQTKPDQTKPDQAKPDQTKSDQSKPDQSKPDQSKPDQSKPEQSKPFEPPAPFFPPSDIKPLPPGDKVQERQSKDNSSGGKSPIVELYERKQGARQAGNGGTLPPIDAIPNPGDLVIPTPGPIDLRPPAPGPDLTPKPLDDTRPKPGPDLLPKPLDDRKEPSDLIKQLEPKYETKDIGTAVKMARELGVPLAVHIGAQWCHYCVEMERNTWPSVEGTSSRQGSMQGKMVVLHLDVDDQRGLRGEDARFAAELTKNRGNSIPILRVFQIDQAGRFSKTNENRGAINSKSQLEAFLIKGGVKR